MSKSKLDRENQRRADVEKLQEMINKPQSCVQCGQDITDNGVLTSDGYFCNGICHSRWRWNQEKKEASRT